MATITCKIPDSLNDQLEAEAARKLLPKSELVRQALERLLKDSAKKTAPTAFDRVKSLCGIVKEGPTDVSTNPKYLEDFGA
jgi:Arc/MetJ-type ribon-helix-helix transcriptional regulator